MKSWRETSDEEEEEEGGDLMDLDANGAVIPLSVQRQLFGPGVDEFGADGGEGARGVGRTRNKLPPHINHLMGEANMLYAQGDYERAEERLQLVISQIDNVPAPYLTLGLICEEKGRIHEAARFYMLAAELSKKNPLMWKRVGKMFAEIGDWNAAVKCFGRSLAQDQSDSSLLYMRAQIYEKMGELRRAATDYQHFIDREPHVLNAYKEASKIYHALGQFGQVVETLHRGYQIMKTDGLNYLDFDLLNMYSECKLLEGEWKTVVDIVQLADRQNPSNLLPLQLRAKLIIALCYLDKIAQAEPHLDILESQPVEQWPDLFKEVADCLVVCELANHALRFLIPLNTIPPYKNNPLLMQIISCYIKLDKIPQAIEYSLEAINSIVHQNNHPTPLPLDEKEVRVKICLTLAELHRISKNPQRGIDVIQLFQNNPIVYKNVPHAHHANPTIEHLFPSTHVDLYYLEQAQTNISPLDDQSKHSIVDAENDHRLTMQKAKLHFDLKNYQLFLTLLTPILLLDELIFYNHKKRLRLTNKSINHDKIPHLPESNKPRKNIWMLIGIEPFTSLLINYYKCLSLQKYPSSPPFETLKRLFDLVIGETEFVLVPHPLKDLLYFTFSKLAYEAHEYNVAISVLKPVCCSHPNNPHAWNLFYKIASKSRRFFLTRGFVFRLLKKNNNCIPLLLLAGHISQAAGSHKNALFHYLKAHQLSPKMPLLLLCIGVAYLNLAIYKRTSNKHQTILNAFTFLFAYHAQITRPNNNNNNPQDSHQAHYNLARAFHQLNLHHLAIPFYEKVLFDLNLLHPHQTGPTIGHLKREAAYNLSLIYRSTNSPSLAIQMLKNFLTI